MRVAKWERYIPDVEDNRARHARGDPALVVELRSPTSRLWREFWGRVTADETRLRTLRELVERDGDDGPGRALSLALFDDELAGILFLGCVRAVEVPDGFVEGLDTPIRNGGELWAARELLDSPSLFPNLLDAILDRTLLAAGLADFLASRSGRAGSPEPDRSPDGTAASVATRA